MTTITNIPRHIKLYGAMLAIAALVIGLTAVAFTTGPAQAQNASNTGPQPCGPGQATAFQPEPHEVTTGHFAFFDAYWYTTGSAPTTGGGLDDNAPGVGVLHINECPPLMVKKTQTDPDTEVETVTITRSVSNIDIEEAIMHVKDKHMATVVATNAEATAGQLSLDEYPDVRSALDLEKGDPVPAGTKVWWLKLDDPDTTADDTSDLGMGFSTFLLDDDDWLTSNEQKSMRYKLEVESYPASPSKPNEVPYFFTYKAPKTGNAEAELVWDSTKPGDETTDMLMDPGEFEAMQWVFTKRGTHVLTVELQGHVRNADNKLSGAGENWRPISGNVTETAIATYTIQVGNPLPETEPPIFGVNREVDENSPGGTKVGGPIPVYNADADKLVYKLTGEGSKHFDAGTSTKPHTAQIVVADGARLDYETKPSYELVLSVTDNLDHEGNEDLTVDDILIVNIDLKDEGPWLKLYSSHSSLLAVGETVTLTSHYEPSPERRGQTPRYEWGEQFQTTTDGVKWQVIAGATGPTLSITKETETTRTYRVSVVWGDAENRMSVDSNEVTVIWERRD